MFCFRLLRLLGSVLLSLGWPALVSGLSLGGGGMVAYAWFILVFYGWWVYAPVVALHRLALGRFRHPTRGHSVVAGALLAGLVAGALMLNEYNRHFPTPTIPAFSAHRALDVVNFAVAGALYGWLYWHWAKRQGLDAAGNEPEQQVTEQQIIE